MKRHDLDLLSFVCGVLFAGLGVVFALKALGAIDLDLGLLPALSLIVIGVAVCASVMTSLLAARPEPATVRVDHSDSEDSEPLDV